ncbi:hypothetical protein V6N13_116622 [Hibiscus sabdariffa]|uniref:DUF7890 domain-containing protein n=2 Tax=Hibiscus sabdariffa TaxID=183260 RepID=A0ABR2A5X3_9ROSI
MLTFIATCLSKVLRGESKLSKNRKSCEGDPKPKMSRVRVKVKMTKEEAGRLLSRCKDGGIIEFKDAARELVKLPMNRVTLLSPCNPLLDSIPEEF